MSVPQSDHVVGPRTKVPCLSPRQCGVQWHWLGTEAQCGAQTGVVRRPLVAIERRGSAPAARPDFGLAPMAVDALFSEDAWAEVSAAGQLVHGLQVNRLAVEEVVTSALRGDREALAAILASGDDEARLAHEVLCVDPATRLSVVRGLLGPSLELDESLVESVDAHLQSALLGALPADDVDVDEDSPLRLTRLPHFRDRVSGVVDACFAALVRAHAYDAMIKDTGAELLKLRDTNPDAPRVVAVSTSGPLRLKAIEKEALAPANWLALTVSEKAGSFDPDIARAQVSPEVWARAVELTPQESTVSLTKADLAPVAKSAGISLDAYLKEATTSVTLSVTLHGKEGDKGESDSTSAKRLGAEMYAAGKSKPGSHFYVPPRTGDFDRDLASLVSARARAEKRKGEAEAVADTIKPLLRSIESIAVNQTLHHAGSDRDFKLLVSKSTRLDVEAFELAHPGLAKVAREKKVAASTPSVTAEALRVAIRETDAASGIARSEAEVEKLVDGFRKSSTPALRLRVREGNTSVAPSTVGARQGLERISRGEALGGRILSEAFDTGHD